jgi:hypothetical protein
MTNIIYANVIGDLGNQLFQIFNILSLCKESKSLKYKLNFNDLDGKHTCKYKLLKNIRCFTNVDKNSFKSYKESSYYYNKIILENNIDYEIIGNFQSYKYFWTYNDFIKKKLNINNDLINNILELYKNFNKKVIALHIQLNHNTNEKFHIVPPIDYYKYCLSKFNLDEFEIILFSDDLVKAEEILSSLNIKYINSNNYYKKEEEQFYMMMLTDVLIGSNSAFSLMASYINEMYKFKKHSKYYFPQIWFEADDPSLNIENFELNKKYNFIDYNNCKINKPLNKKHKIVFFSTFYILKSKFDQNKYIKWFSNFINIIGNFKIIIFTNKMTFKFLKSSNLNLNNIEFIIKEIKCFKYHKFEKQISENLKYFPLHDISWKLILLYINRHLFVEEVKLLFNSEYYMHIDIGYFRDFKGKNLNLNLSKFPKDKIVIGRTTNNKDVLNKINNSMKNFNKNEIENNLMQNHIYGGGAQLFPNKLVEKWTEIYKKQLNIFFKREINFKDDQPIITSLVVKYNIFYLIFDTDEKEIPWFPFIDYLFST